MGLTTCCGANVDQDAHTGPMFVENGDPAFKVMEAAKFMTPHQMLYIVKLQARIRGMICRNKLKASPKYKNLFKNHVVPEDKGQASYLNERRVQEIRNQLGDYKYDPSPDPSLTQLPLEIRPAKILDGRVKYEGQWIVGTNIRAGRGQQYWPDGSVYEGHWKDNKANGKGRLIHVDGSMYQGEWKDDNCHGKGIYYHLNCTNYDGEWQENAQHSKGVETWADGTKYEGHFDQGKKSGEGTFTWSDGSSYQGNFCEDKFQGKGTYIWGDGRKYVGEWCNNKMHGSNGTFWWPNGKKYEGHWKDGKQDGEGTFTQESGKIRKGIWKQGKRVQWLDEEDQK